MAKSLEHKQTIECGEQCVSRRLISMMAINYFKTATFFRFSLVSMQHFFELLNISLTTYRLYVVSSGTCNDVAHMVTKN